MVSGGVPTPRGHVQGPPDALRTPTRRLTTSPRLSPPLCGTWDDVGSGWVGVVTEARGRTAVVSGETPPTHTRIHTPTLT